MRLLVTNTAGHVTSAFFIEDVSLEPALMQVVELAKQHKKNYVVWLEPILYGPFCTISPDTDEDEVYGLCCTMYSTAQ